MTESWPSCSPCAQCGPNCPWKKSSLPFFHSVARWKSRGFPRSTGIASSDAAHYPQPAKAAPGNRMNNPHPRTEPRKSANPYVIADMSATKRLRVPLNRNEYAPNPRPFAIGAPPTSSTLEPWRKTGGALGIAEIYQPNRPPTPPSTVQLLLTKFLNIFFQGAGQALGYPTFIGLFSGPNQPSSALRSLSLWIEHPPPDAAGVAPGNPRDFLGSTEWTVFNSAGMDDFFHCQ